MKKLLFAAAVLLTTMALSGTQAEAGLRDQMKVAVGVGTALDYQKNEPMEQYQFARGQIGWLISGHLAAQAEGMTRIDNFSRKEIRVSLNLVF